VGRGGKREKKGNWKVEIATSRTEVTGGMNTAKMVHCGIGGKLKSGIFLGHCGGSGGRVSECSRPCAKEQ